MLKTLALLGTVLALSSCAGIRQTDNQFTAHAESFRIVGFSIPHDDQEAARKLVPNNATITSIHSTSADWTSISGFFGNLLWFHQTSVSGTK